MALNRENISKLFQGAAGVGGVVAPFFDKSKNPADVASQDIGQIPGKTQPYYQPYFNEGVNQLGQTSGQYTGLMSDPAGKLNDIGKGYQQSPGFKFALEQALGGSGHAAAAGGMAGSPQHEQQNMELATQLGNQDYNNWLQQATGLYGQGLTGGQNMANQGQQAGQSQADMIAQALAQQGNLGYAGQQNKNQANANMWGGIGKGIGALSAFTPWGGIGSALGSFFGGGK